ncbi:MAG TPA: DUF302 domain-containing protein [Polyangiaceae bacterium]|nr:DUF302 domain-containing protein [Polyangiaceae bacterium]
MSHEAFTRSLEALLGRTDLEALSDLAALPVDAAKAKLTAFVGPLDFSLFQKLDHGALLTVFRGERVRATTYVVGNALIAVQMTKHEPRAALYVPLRLFVLGIDDAHVIVTYDRPSALMAQFGSPDVDAVARELDVKLERLLDETAARARAA